MSGILRRPFTVAVVASLVVIVVGTSVVLGATVATNGGPVTSVRTKTATDGVLTSSTSATDLAGMTLSVAVPANQNAMLVITFSAETACSGSVTFAPCYIRVLLDGVAARPGNVIFDATDETPAIAPLTTNSMQFVAGPAGPGTHYVRVQFWADTDTFFSVRARTITVLRAQV